jgi:hypothetical protein
LLISTIEGIYLFYTPQFVPDFNGDIAKKIILKNYPSEFLKTANSQYFFAKISGIGSWETQFF